MVRCKQPVPWTLFGVFLIALLAPLGVTGQGPDEPVSEPDEDNVLVVPDRPNDVGPLGRAPPSGTPMTTMFQHVDMREVRIGPETVDSLAIEIDLGGWDPNIQPTMNDASLSGMDCYIRWHYAAFQDVTYTLTLSSTDVDADGPDIAGRLQFYYWNGTTGGYNNDQIETGFEAEWIEETPGIRVVLPKSFIPQFPGPHSPGDGVVMILERFDCASDVAAFGQYRDLLDDYQNVRYRFRSPGAGEVVRIGTSSGKGPAMIMPETWAFPRGTGITEGLGVEAGKPNIVPIHLTNLQDEKKLVLLSTSQRGEGGGTWNLSITPSVFLKPEESRTLNLIVTAPEGVAMGALIAAEIEAKVAGDESIGVASVPLRVAPILGDRHDTIHFHGKIGSNGLGPVYDEYYRPHSFMVSLFDEEAGWDATMMDPGPTSSRRYYAELAPLGAPVRLRGSEDATLQMAVAGEDGAIHRVDLSVLDDEGKMLYEVERELAVGVHTIPLVPLFDNETVLDAGTRIEFNLYHQRRTMALKSGIDPTQSHLTLPVVSSDVGLAVTDGRYLPNLALGPDEDKTTYMNAGKEYAFELNLSNDGIEDDDIRVTATTNATGWTIQILPGALFRIPAGASTPVGIEVVSPADAKEGALAEIKVKAVSKHDPAASATIGLKAVVTNGLGIEAKPYADKEGQLEPLSEANESPLSGLAVVGAVLACAFLLRRRRDG